MQLIADITKMLQQEGDQPDDYFERGTNYPVLTPTITPDDASYKAAFQLQQLWEKHEDS